MKSNIRNIKNQNNDYFRFSSACHTSAVDMDSYPSTMPDSGVQSQNVIDCGTGWIYSDDFGCILFNTDYTKVIFQINTSDAYITLIFMSKTL